MTIPDELVEIGAKALQEDGAFDLRPCSELSRNVLTAVLPELARMMMEPSDDMARAYASADGAVDEWQAQIAAFFKEKFGLEIA